MTKFILSMLIPFIAASIGSFFTASNVSTWYTTLQRPSFSPPNWIFTPVWILLYLMMGFALYLVWKQGWKSKQVKTGMILFFIQLALNALWSVLFFGMQSPLYGLICIIFLWAGILATIITFYRVNKNAAYLLIPYFLWVSFAAILNYYIYILNIAAL